MWFSPLMDGETGKLAPRTSTMAQRLTASKKPRENFIKLQMTPNPLLSLTIDLLPELMGPCPGDPRSVQGAKILGFSVLYLQRFRTMIKCGNFLAIVHQVDI